MLYSLFDTKNFVLKGFLVVKTTTKIINIEITIAGIKIESNIFNLDLINSFL